MNHAGLSRRRLTALLDDPLPFLDDEDGAVRRLAVSALHRRAHEVTDALGAMVLGDPDATVRAEAAEVLASAGDAALAFLDRARDDGDERVVEAVATAYGEMSGASAVPWLIDRARDAENRRIAEAAVAALGAIGDERARPVLVALAESGAPQVRRRAVVALTAFDGPDVEEAIRRAAGDRNPMVREAAEMVVGRPAPP